MQYYPAKILIHFKSSKVKIIVSNKYIINYKAKSKINASLVIENRNIVWGRNWDLIFPLNELHEGHIQ